MIMIICRQYIFITILGIKIELENDRKRHFYIILESSRILSQYLEGEIREITIFIIPL